MEVRDRPPEGASSLWQIWQRAVIRDWGISWEKAGIARNSVRRAGRTHPILSKIERAPEPRLRTRRKRVACYADRQPRYDDPFNE
jgi:hypothetical protein